ncbi:MAG: T9SS type A sorting domain-containing protein [Candidatus Cloacimonetes bacterium]|jgi:hypothetical protein|nr:T9SS type A sorting domain-containing protein [Candidatus Cloacimonadota bacterium]
MKKANLVYMLLIFIVVLSAQNNALDFDGTDDYVTCGNMNLSNQSFAIEGWFKVNTLPGAGNYAFIFGNVIETVNAAHLRINGSSNRLEFVMGTQYGWNVPTSNTVIETGVWYHVAIVNYQNQGGAGYDYRHIFINGVVDVSTNYLSIFNYSNSTFRIGGSGDTAYLDGLVDEVKVWANTARSISEVRDDMYRGVVGNETGLLAYYNLNATSGITTDNLEGAVAYDGTLTNMTGDEWTTSSAFFGPKNCLDFDGNDFVLCGNDASLTQFNNFTMEAWVKLDNSATNQKILGKFDNWDPYGNYYMIGVGNGKQYSQINANGNTIDFSAGDVPSNKWTHLAVTFSKGNGGANGTCYGYVNGEVVYSKTDVADAAIDVSNATYQFRIGAAPWDYNYFQVNGLVDEVRIWNSQRSTSEIRENMYKNLIGDESNLVAYYNLDNTSGTSVPCYPEYDNNGTNYGATWVASSAFNTWIDTDDSSWSTASNWSRGSVPSSSENVGIYDYPGGTSPSLSGNPTLANLIVDDDFTLSSALTITDQLIIESDLDLNGQAITLNSSASLIESGGNLYGTTGTIQTTRDLNNIDEDVAGLGAEITENGDLGETTIIRGHEAQGSQGINRYYHITTEFAPTNVTLVFNYLDSELNGVTEDDLDLFKSTDGNDWVAQSVALPSDNTLTLTGINSFSWWTAGDGDAPLPVNLSSFYALYEGGTPTLYWTTQTEENNAYWNVYRGTTDNFENSININANSPVPGNGTTNSANDYVYVDIAPVVQNATYWYWIEDVSTDGETTVHDPITLSIPFEDTPITPENYGLMQNYPNPFNPSTSISFALAEDSNVELTIYNVRGEKVKTIFTDHVYSDQINSVVWNGNDANGKHVSSGIYFYKLKTGTREYNKKMLMVK